MGIAQMTAKQPVLKLRLMLNWSYASVIVLVVVVGTVLYGILYILPQVLSGVSLYNAQQTGNILFLSGIPAFLMMPVLPIIMGRMNARLTVFIGLVCFAVSCFIDTSLSPDVSGNDFVVSQLLRGFGQMLAFMPLNQASVGAVSREDAADAAGLYNMARNMGGSIGLALLGVFIDRRVEAHADAIRETVSANSPRVQDYITSQAASFAANSGDLAHGRMQALAQLAGTIHVQALVMTYADCFFVLGVALSVLTPLVLLLRPPPRLGTER